MRKQNKKRLGRVKNLIRLHLIVTAILLGVYFTVAFMNPGFLAYDLRGKYHVLADTLAVSAKVLAPPQKPIVTVQSQCNQSTGVLSVLLDWADDENSTSFDITRDGSPLVTGLSSSTYRDTNVAVATTYEYVVTARGPMGPGFADSDPVSVSTDAECEVTLIEPHVSIVTFSGRDVSTHEGPFRTGNTRPVFSGTTSMPNASIDIAVGKEPHLTARIFANENGYWSWQPPVSISSGPHLFTVTATDPEDSARTDTGSLAFSISEDNTGNGMPKGGGALSNSPLPTVPNIAVEQAPAPFDYSMQVSNTNKTVAQGECFRRSS